MELGNLSKHEDVVDMSEVDGGRDIQKEYNGMMDRIDMDRLGKKQELKVSFIHSIGHSQPHSVADETKRNFRLLSIFSFMCIAMSTWVFVIR